MKLHKLGAALAFTALAVTSYAAPLITVFSASTHGGFIAGTASCVAGVTSNCDLGSTATAGLSGAQIEPAGLIPNGVLFDTVSWGIGEVNPTLQSSLQAAHLSGVALTVNGAAQRIDSFVHNNNVLNFRAGINYLDAVTVYGSVSLTAGAGSFPDFSPAVLGTNYFPGTSAISFTETLNAGSCSGLNPLGSQCDDFFETDGLDATALFYIDPLGTKYYIEFGWDNGSGFVVDGDVLDKRVYTREGAQSIVYTTARIFTVPEPDMLALFGFALIGVALSRRRKVNV